MDLLELLGGRRLYGEIAVGVRDLDRGIDWYCAMFDVVEGAATAAETVLGYSGGKGRSFIPLVVLVRIPAGRDRAAVGTHPILFTRNLKKTHQDFLSKGIAAGPIEHDSGGNYFFVFEDFEGNLIEVCLEPGKKLS
jgi:catechol 2,3-dioxygenase-like lactoylglutathione lyase family enzyme